MKNLSIYIAFRYLFSKKSTNAINLITGIAIAGIAMGTAALILILSVFNGFEGLMKSNLDSFNPAMKIVPSSGKFFNINDQLIIDIKQIDGIQELSISIEDVALFEYAEKQQIGIIKGVDSNYLNVTTLESAIIEGIPDLSPDSDQNYATVGNGIYYNLDINIKSQFTPVKVYVPNRKARGPLDKEFKSRPLFVSAIFKILNERDNQYILTNYDLVANLLGLRNKASAIELKVSNTANERQIRSDIMRLYPHDFKVLNRFQQDESFLKIMNIEKWSAYLILGFTLLLITFNVIGSLWMIVLEKRKDLSVLQSFGATKRMIKNIFLTEGILISSIGFAIGFGFAIVFYILQKTVGIISVPEGYNIASYPILMEGLDVFTVFITVIVLGFLASLPAAIRAGRISAFVRME